MAIQLSVTARNNRLDSIQTTSGSSSVLKLVTGSVPANCAAADPNTVCSIISLPSNWMAAASAGQKAMLGTWQDPSAVGTGTVAHFRIYDTSGSTCHIQGTVTATGGGGDMTLNSTSVSPTQVVNITGFTLTDGNA